MPRSKRNTRGSACPHLSVNQLGRQLRAAFEPVPTGIDDFADLLAQIDRAERSAYQRQAAE
jgi:hypothetical protein